MRGSVYGKNAEMSSVADEPTKVLINEMMVIRAERKAKAYRIHMLMMVTL